jgi:hypothetical protein
VCDAPRERPDKDSKSVRRLVQVNGAGEVVAEKGKALRLKGEDGAWAELEGKWNREQTSWKEAGGARELRRMGDWEGALRGVWVLSPNPNRLLRLLREESRSATAVGLTFLAGVRPVTR